MISKTTHVCWRLVLSFSIWRTSTAISTIKHFNYSSKKVRTIMRNGPHLWTQSNRKVLSNRRQSDRHQTIWEHALPFGTKSKRSAKTLIDDVVERIMFSLLSLSMCNSLSPSELLYLIFEVKEKKKNLRNGFFFDFRPALH